MACGVFPRFISERTHDGEGEPRQTEEECV